MQSNIDKKRIVTNINRYIATATGLNPRVRYFPNYISIQADLYVYDIILGHPKYLIINVSHYGIGFIQADEQIIMDKIYDDTESDIYAAVEIIVDEYLQTNALA